MYQNVCGILFGVTGANLTSIRTILPAFTSIGYHLVIRAFEQYVELSFIYGISLITKFSENPTISIIPMFFTNFEYLFLNFLIRIFSIKTLLPIHICGFGIPVYERRSFNLNCLRRLLMILAVLSFFASSSKRSLLSSFKTHSRFLI